MVYLAAGDPRVVAVIAEPAAYPALKAAKPGDRVEVQGRVTWVQGAQIADPKLRDQALRAAKSVCLNIAEANGRASPADRKRVFAIARGEASEAAASVHVASLSGLCAAEHAERVRKLGGRAVALLTGLIRR